MNCAAFEALFERLTVGEVTPAERQSAARHAGRCPACRELLELAQISAGPEALGAPPPDDLLARVLAETAGSGCQAAESFLCELVDGQLDADDAELVGGHLAACSECAALERVICSLAEELPGLAEIRPDRRFATDVLAATLPWPVRARRWWQRSWPRWVRRPRFALEAAYAATIVLVVLFTLPVSPLEAMPRRAVRIVQNVPAPELTDGWAQLEAELSSRVSSVGRLEGVRAVVDGWRETIELGAQAVERSRTIARATPGWAVEQIRTLWAQIASLLERADGDPAAADPDSDKEIS